MTTSSAPLSGASAPCGWLAMGDDCVITAHNEELGRALGYEPGELCGCDVRKLLAPMSILYFHMQVAPALESGNRIEEVYLSLACKSGGEIPVLFNAVRRTDVTPHVTEAIVVPIRERKGLEDVLHRLRKAADLAPGAILQLLVRPDGSICIPYASEGIHAMYGARPGQLQHRADLVFAVIDPEDLRTLLDELRRAAGEATELRHEHRVRLSNQSVRWRAILAKPERLPDGGVLFHGYVFDTSEQRATEMAILEKDVFERASRAKSDFLASMSHELRTPLNAILGLSEALQENVYGPLAPRQSVTVSRIEESGRHLLALINDILDVAKVEAGKIDLDRSPVVVADLCRASIRLVHEAARTKQQEIGFEITAPIDRIVVDDRRMKQVIVNLLSNAVKFTPPRGVVRLTVSLGDAPEEARIVVADTGMGIAPASIDRLFQPFVQIDSGLTREHAGTGLGLVLVRRIVELHGGDVRVESALGQGSRFIVTLPGAIPRANANDPTARATLLLADDDDTNVATLVDYLGAQGFEVAIAHDGREAVELARALRPSAILMDVRMPGMDGLAAMRKIRAAESTRDAHTPIIAVTALASPSDEQLCRAAGADAYLAKPVSLKGLLATIHRQIASRTPPAS